MPLRNRVTPEGDIVAVADRGTMYGVRGGCFHRPDQTLRPRLYASKNWICCVLEFKGRKRKLMQPGLYTELFFLDEATAWAAGHRPCFECRRADAMRFAETWNAINGVGGRAAATDMDRRLHAERIDGHGRKVTYEARLSDLPDGAMVRHQGQPALVFGGCLLPWSFAGYRPAVVVARETALPVLTPPTTIAVMRAGYTPTVHVSAQVH